MRCTILTKSLKPSSMASITPMFAPYLMHCNAAGQMSAKERSHDNGPHEDTVGVVFYFSVRSERDPLGTDFSKSLFGRHVEIAMSDECEYEAS